MSGSPDNDDLSGQRFGRLVVAGKAGRSKQTKRLVYFCVCDCGKRKFVRKDLLLRGTVVSCGCMRLVKSLDQVRSRIGVKHGKLFVVGFRGAGFESSGAYLCLCECGRTVKIYRHRDLVNGKTTSCGCVAQDVRSQNGSMHGHHSSPGIWLYKQGNHLLYMKSSFECRFADILTHKGLRWQYEPKTFKLRNGMRYTPDFLVGDTWYEVKGHLTALNKLKIRLLREQGHKLVLVMQDEIDRQHPVSYQHYLRRHGSPDCPGLPRRISMPHRHT